MTKRKGDLDNFQSTICDKFAIIVPDDDQAREIADEYSSISGHERYVHKYKNIEIYQVQRIIFAHIPGYSHTAVSTLYNGLRSLLGSLGGSYHRLFVITTAVSCACVKERDSNLISIDTIYSMDCNNKEEFGFYLPEGTKKIYPATAVSAHCDLKKLPKNLQDVQVLLNLNITVDALSPLPKFLSPNQIVVMAVNVGKIACKYKPTTVRKLLFDNLHFQDFVKTVAMFASSIVRSQIEDSLPMTPPDTCKKQRQFSSSELEDELLKTFPIPTNKGEHCRHKEVIEKFEKEVLITTLPPKELPNFARCLGLTDNDFATIEYEHNYRNPKEQMHCIINEWYEKEGFHANVIEFNEALKDMGKKELHDNFLLYCSEAHN